MKNILKDRPLVARIMIMRAPTIPDYRLVFDAVRFVDPSVWRDLDATNVPGFMDVED